MNLFAVSDVASVRPPTLPPAEFLGFKEMIACLSSEFGPVRRASSFLGFGNPGGGGYAGHAEMLDLDGLLRDMYDQPSMEAGVNDSLFGGGKGWALQGTMLSTIGEAVERGVATLVACAPDMPGARLFASYDDLRQRGIPALSPKDMHLFSPEQYASPRFLYEPFTCHSMVQWVPGKRLRSGEEIYVPAQLVDLVHIFDPGEALVGYPVSGGLSCHTSLDAAVYHGLTEVIERHDVNVTWYTPDPPHRLVIDDQVRGLLGDFVDRLVLDHSEAYILLHRSGLTPTPTFSVVGIQDGLARRQYCAGGGADVEPITALTKAAVEFGQTRSTLGIANAAPRSSVGRSVKTMFDWEPGRPLAEMTLFFQAIGYYGLPEHRPLLDSYLSGPEITFADIQELAGLTDTATTTDERLDRLLGQLDDESIDPIVIDYSHPDWNQLAIVKVFVPELTTPFLQSRPMLGHPRLSPLRDGLTTDAGRILPLPYP